MLKASTFGVFGFQVDMSANVQDHLQPGNTVIFQNSVPLFNTVEGESANILYTGAPGVNGSGRSTNISSAFASSLASADGNGGVGVSELLFFTPGGSDPNALRQLSAETFWTQTFMWNVSFPVDISLHLHIPELEVGLLGVPPRRDFPSATETALAEATLTTVITHPDGTITKGGSLDIGLKLHEIQLPSGPDLLNVAALDVLGNTGSFGKTPEFHGDDFEPSFTLDSISTDVKLGTLHNGDILSYVYSLKAEGTTHGFERGYFAFLGDPFGVDVIGDNLTATVTPVTDADAPEASTCLLMVSGLAGMVAWRRRTRRSKSREAGIIDGSVLCPNRFPRPTWSEFTRSFATLRRSISSGALRRRVCNRRRWSTRLGSGWGSVPGKAARIFWR
jgi:hypothetical protein